MRGTFLNAEASVRPLSHLKFLFQILLKNTYHVTVVPAICTLPRISKVNIAKNITCSIYCEIQKFATANKNFQCERGLKLVYVQCFFVISGVRSRLLGGCVERRTLKGILDVDDDDAASGLVDAA